MKRLIANCNYVDRGIRQASWDGRCQKRQKSQQRQGIDLLGDNYQYTRGQIISPPIVISHNKDFQLFSLGNPHPPDLPYSQRKA